MREPRSTLEAEIRFHLEQLSSRNAHHEFEVICRRHARARICDRVLPATGPVAAGGDQGRDFETFKSFKKPTGTELFVGSNLGGELHLVFACTTQKDGLPSKIKGDITEIMRGAVRPDHIYYYSVQDLSVSRRHDLQAWAKKKFEVGLDIIDGQALSTDLADPALYWIAVDHLAMSITKAPPPGKGREKWYEEALRRWREAADEIPRTTAEYLTLRNAARHFLQDESAKSDLPLWLAALGSFAQLAVDNRAISLEARYERLVLTIRGRETLEGEEAEIEAFQRDVIEHGALADFENLMVVLSYVFGAIPRGAVALSPEVLSAWRNALLARTSEVLQTDPSGLDRCRLLDIQASLHILEDAVDRRPAALRQAMSCWATIADAADKEPLFEVETLSGRLTLLTPLIVLEPGFQHLCDAMDRIVAKRAGDAAAASKARDRGMALYANDLLVEAIDHLHKAKILWFGKATIRGTALSMLVLSLCYSRLQCMLAAKYYAMAAAMLVAEDDKRADIDLFPRALALAAASDFNEGAWLSHLSLAQLYWPAHVQFETQLWDIEEHEHLGWMCGAAASILAWGHEHSHALEAKARETVPPPLADVVDALASSVNPADPPGGERAVVDAGERRTWVWKGLGVTWRISWSNTRENTAVAEALGAFIQLLVVDVSTHDLEVLPMEVSVEVEVVDTGPVGLKESRRPNIDWDFRTRRTETSDSRTLSGLLAAASLRLLGSVCLTPELLTVLERRFEAGLVDKTLVVRSYSHLYLALVAEATYAETMLALRDEGIAGVRPADDPVTHLRWRDGVAGGYAQKDVPQMLRNRYQAGTLSTQKTLPRLAQDGSFRSTVASLREQGWLGWQIASAIGCLTAARVLQAEFGREWPFHPTARERMGSMTHDAEERDPGIPATEYSEKALLNQMQMNMMSTLATLGLRLHERRVGDVEAVREYLAVRFRFFEDDLPELDPLRAFGL